MNSRIVLLLYILLKVAQNSFQHIPRRRFWWVIITTVYQLMLQSWYQKTALYMELRATLNFRKFKVALNPTYRIFLNFAKSWVLSSLIWKVNSRKKKFTAPFLNYKPLKLQLRVFFRKLNCCYGNLLARENDNNVFTNDWAVSWYHDSNIKWERVVKHPNVSAGNCFEPP